MTTERPAPRNEPRPESSRERAAARAAALRDHMGDMDDGEDRFAIRDSSIPDGWTYEWKRKTTYGKDDPSYDVQVARAGWDPVPADRHPEYMPPGFKGKTIERDGMILCERPTEIVMERREMERRKAKGQVRDKEIQLGAAPDGQFERRATKGDKIVSRQYEHVKVPNLETIAVPD
jgi:hypothetical protein